MLIVLPAMLLRGIGGFFYGLLFGKKAAAPAPAAKQNAGEKKGEKEVKKGTCPYHAFMNFFGFKIPEKKPV